VHDIAAELAPLKGRVEFNIEGDPRPGFAELVLDVRPDQCTLVPVKPGEITSEAGWPAGTPRAALGGIIDRFKAAGVRVSLFVDAEPGALRWARDMGADRVELYTEPFARAFDRGPPRPRRASRATWKPRGWRTNSGWHQRRPRSRPAQPHAVRTLPHLDEVSIGHALISRAIFVGLGRTVREYLEVLG